MKEVLKIQGITFKKTKIGSKWAKIIEEDVNTVCDVGVLKIDLVYDNYGETTEEKIDFVIIISPEYDSKPFMREDKFRDIYFIF